MRKFALSLVFFALIALVSASETEDLLRLLLSKKTGKLSIQNFDTANLQATYSRKQVGAEIQALEGVRIETEVNDDIERVKIQDLDGKAIISYHHLRNDKNKAAIVNIMGQTFVTMKDKEGSRHDYHVPEVFSEGLNRAFRQGEFDPGYLEFLDSHGVESVRVAAIQEMLAGQEIPLMREAVEAIGQRGIIGKDNPSALPVMMMVMRFSALRDKEMKKNEAISQWSLWNPRSWIATKPENCKLKPGQIKCSTTGSCCDSKNLCPDKREDHCNGMCGYGCDCWKFACGDCCVHKGCLGHDNCCRKDKSMWNTGCLLPYGFKCSKPYEC